MGARGKREAFSKRLWKTPLHVCTCSPPFPKRLSRPEFPAFSTIAAASIGHALQPKSDPPKRQENPFRLDYFTDHDSLGRQARLLRFGVADVGLLPDPVVIQRPGYFPGFGCSEASSHPLSLLPPDRHRASFRVVAAQDGPRLGIYDETFQRARSSPGTGPKQVVSPPLQLRKHIFRDAGIDSHGVL